MQGFGQWLLAKRKAAGLTQGQLAAKADISTSYVSTLEREQKHSVTNTQPQPARDVVEALAKALDAATDEALLAAGYAPSDLGPLFAVLPDDLSLKLGTEVTAEERQEIAEELALAYEVIMARRKRRLSQNE